MFLLLFSFSLHPFPQYFFPSPSPWSGISLPTDCTVPSASCCCLKQKILYINIYKNAPLKNQTKTFLLFGNQLALFNILTILNFIIHEPISPFPAGTLPFLRCRRFAQPSLSPPIPYLFPVPPLPCLCCSLKRVTPQCLFILFGMLSFTLYYLFHLFFTLGGKKYGCVLFCSLQFALKK